MKIKTRLENLEDLLKSYPENYLAEIKVYKFNKIVYTITGADSDTDYLLENKILN